MQSWWSSWRGSFSTSWNALTRRGSQTVTFLGGASQGSRVNRPTERAQGLSPCMLVQREARGIGSSRGEGRAQGGVIVERMGSETGD
jgi:hypothetical protein